MFRISVLLFIILSQAVSALAAAPELSFSAARALLHERSDALRAASANTESKRETVSSLKTLWGPTISAQAGEIWGEARVKIDQKIHTELGSMPIDISESRNFNGPRAAVSGSWPLFTGGKILAEQRAGKYALEEAEAGQRQVGIEQDLKLIGAYFGLQLARSIESVRKEMLTQQERELARARKFEAEGMISKIERMSVQVARDKGEREWLKARDNTRVSRIQLGRLLRSENFGLLATPLFVSKRDFGSMQSWVDAAGVANPRIAASDAAVRKAEQGVAAARGSFSPDVFAFGSYSFIHPQHTVIEPEWIAGIGLNFTLWDSRGRLGKYRSAAAVSREARALAADVANQVRADAEIAWQNCQNARERYLLTAGNVSLARENLKLKTAGFEEGLNTALEMTDARAGLAEAQVERKVAAWQFVVNFAILHALAGRMDEFARLAQGRDLAVER